MEKSVSGKNTKKWLIPVVAVVLLAAIGAGLFFLLGGESETAQPTTAPTTEPQATTAPVAQEEELLLYWNVDREAYVAAGYEGANGRLPRGDGLYYVRMAVNGEQVDFPVADRTLVERIDMQDIMSLVFDENGVVVDVRTINDCTGGALAPTMYVRSVDGNKVVANTQGNGSGLDIPFEIDENTKVYNVGGEGLLVGLPGKIAVDDEVIAIRDYEGKIIYVFIKPYQEPRDIYWNLVRKYDSTTKMTTRESSVTGVFEFEMACNGEKVIVRTRDQKVANSIDAKAAKWQHLQFDEEGYAISTTTSAGTCRTSGTFGSWTRVTEINGDQFKTLKIGSNLDGTIYEGEITEKTKIIDVSARDGYTCAYTELRIGDLVHGLYDLRGNLSHIFVIERLADYPLYWNCERLYDSTLKCTKRIPAADGYYYFDVATGGEQIRVRTNDKAIANQLDSYAARCFGMTLDGDVITGLYGASSVHGGATYGSWYIVDKLEGNKITVKRILTGDTEPTYVEGVLAEDVEIINGSTNFKSHCGEYDTLSVGDRVHGLRNLKGEVRVLFIVDKPVDCKVYWNLNRMYSSTTGQTTRVPDEDGYYWFKLAVDGQQIKAKTKDKALATQIDANAARCWGLTIYNGIIYKAHGVSSVRGLSGGTKSMSWVDVISINKYGFTAQKNQAGHKDDGKQFTSGIGWGCKIINTTSATKNYMGEYTDLRVGDKVHVLHDGDGYAKYIFIVGGRTPELNTSSEDCPCAQNPTWEPWDGTTDLKDGKFYYLTADVVAPAEGFIIEGKTVALRLDGHTISGPGRLFYGKGAGQLSVCDHKGTGKLISDGVTDEPGGVIRMYSEGGEAYMKFWNVEVTATGVNKPTQGGLVSTSGLIKFFNCNIHDGSCTKTGGNLHVNPTGVLYLFDSTVTGGTATGNGGNIFFTDGGCAYMENVQLADGKSGGKSDNMYVSTKGDVFLKDVTLTNSDTKGGSGLQFTKGTVRLAGNIQICDNGKDNLIMSSNAVFVNEGLDAASKLIVEGAEQDLLIGADTDLSGCFVSTDEKDYVVVYDANNKKVLLDCIIVPKTHEADHCACAGIGAIGDHTCEVLTGWTEITDAVFEDAMGTNGASQGVKFINDGNYYLTLDYAMPKQLCIMPGQKITICLNGCDLTRGGAKLAMVAGELNITDCKGDGGACGADAANGGSFKVVSGGELNLFAGTLTCDSVAGTGAVVNVTQDKGYIAPVDSTEPGIFNMYGGEIKDGASSDSGGNVNVWHSAIFNMYGGTISGGTAAKNGANVSVAGTGARANLYGGTVTGGTGENASICVTTGTLTLGSQAEVTGSTCADLYLSANAKLVIDGYNPTGKTSVAMDNPGTIAETAVDLSSKFTSFDPDLEVTWKSGLLKLSLSSSAQGHIHCICGGSASGMYEHDCENVLFEAWDDATSLPTSGYYYLTTDVTLENLHAVGANTLNICLNGHTISSPNTRAFYMNSSSSYLTVTNCQTTGKLQAKGIADGNGGGVIRNGNATSVVNLYNLTLTRMDDPADRVLVKEGGLISCSGYLNMYNVKATNGYAGSGGGIQIVLTAKVVIVNSEITDCTSVSNNGGCLRVSGNNTANKVSVTLVDTTVTGGKGNIEFGQTVYVNEAAKNDLYLGGTTVIDDLRMAYNGNVHVLDMGLTSGASIGISMVTNGKIGTSASDASAAFQPKDSTLTVAYDAAEKTLSLKAPAVTHAAHCVCAGTGVIGDHTACQSITDWTQITADVFETAMGTNSKAQGIKFIEDGNYFLADNYTLSDKICIMPGQNITLCLSGFELSSSTKVFMCGGNLTITDCVGTGKITSSVTNDNSATMKLVTGANVKLFAGTLSNNGKTTSGTGGVVGVSQDKGNIVPSTSTEKTYFTMYGGTITGGSSAANGGNVAVWHTGSNFTMYGGSVTGGKSGTFGGNISTGTGKVILLGGTISGGTATTVGDDVFVASGAVLTVGNAMTTNVYLAENAEIKPENLTGKITVTMAVPGVFATGIETDISAKFASGNSGYNVAYDAELKVLSLKAQQAHEAHCLCGGKTGGVGDHTCEALTGWTPITSDVFVTSGNYLRFADSGNYYLTADYSLTKAIEIPTGQTINLCLNGHTMTDTIRIFRVNGVLNIADCQTGGELVGSEANAPIFYGYTGGVINLYGGTLRSTYTGTAGYWGGIGALSKDKGMETVSGPSTFNMYGGTIIGVDRIKNSTGSHGNGGAVNVMGASTFRMYGGTIQGAEVENYGGAISVDNGGTFLMTGGTITGGKAGFGDDVRCGKTVTVILGGDAVIGSLALENPCAATLSTDKPLTSAASIGITSNAAGVVVTGMETDLSANFQTSSDYKLVYNATDKTLSLKSKAHEAHCICQGTELETIAGHTCENVTWTALTQAMFDSPDGTVVIKGTTDGGTSQDYTLADGGHYYLAEDITINGTQTPTSGKSFSLCLNGKTLTGTSSIRTMFFKGTVNLCDCQYEDTADGRVFQGELTGSKNDYAPVFYVRAGATMNLYGGNIKGVTLTASAKGGAVAYIGGTMNMYGGKIYGGTSTGNGGNLIITDGATVSMYDGLITGGTAGSTKSGGNIRVDTGYFKMFGGTVSGGTANEGGNIAIGSNGNVELYGGTVENGTANSAGGNFAVFGKLVITDDAVVRNGLAKSTGEYAGGGNIYTFANNTKVIITGGSISGGSAHQGANIFMRTNDSKAIPLTVTGGTVSGVAAGAAGKSIECYSAGTVNITVGGNAVIDELALGARKLTIDAAGFKTGASIGISMATPGTFTTISDSFDYTTVFTPVDAALKVTQTATELKLETK